MASGASTLAGDGSAWRDRYRAVRRRSDHIASLLQPEDCIVQSMPDVSPTRWHLAHTSWFFETFVLKSIDGYQPVDPLFEYLFNSYYNTVGNQFPRDRRGLLSRPTVTQTLDYRHAVDRAMSAHADAIDDAGLHETIDIGLHHEQQHQELMWTDIKHVLSCNPMDIAIFESLPPSPKCSPTTFTRLPESICEIGHRGEGFCFDNELPRHRVLTPDVAIADRLVTAGEYRQFIEDGGYRRPEFWLSAGWSAVQAGCWNAPLYWRLASASPVSDSPVSDSPASNESTSTRDATRYTLAGRRPIDDDAPITHLSYVEADAYARYVAIRDNQPVRLPTEFEWERHASEIENGGGHPSSSAACEDDGVETVEPVGATGDAVDLFGQVWQWTCSSYAAYPGYRPPAGAIGEYNGKFMCNQYVLRGSSVATSPGHARMTYRNFFPHDARWQFTGLRLARDESS